jgi:hypothetical protein
VKRNASSAQRPNAVTIFQSSKRIVVPMESTMPRHFDLNIGKILDQWETRHAMRELIANALDEQAITATAPIAIKDLGGNVWQIRDYGRGLSYEHFQQNESPEKRVHADKVIGKFGFGLKDALATLNRRGVGVRVKSKHGEIALETRGKHGFSDVASLHAIIDDPKDAEFAGTEITLTGIAAAEVEAAKAFFLCFSPDTPLEKTEYGQILARPAKGRARIYVKGLLVAEEDNFLFSYNVTALTKPMEKAMNRERTHVGRTAYSGRIKDMLLKAKGVEVFSALSGEIGKMEAGRASDELQWGAVVRRAMQVVGAQQDKVIFVPASRAREFYGALEDAESDGYKIITVPDGYMPRDDVDLNGNPMRTVSVYLEERCASFKFEFIPYAKLRKAEQAVFDERKNIAALVGGLSRNVKAIEITQVMRPDYFNADHTQGLWDEESGKIVIHRGELKSLAQFAGTLLHEIAHARTGYQDHSREFENELTEMLGMVAATTLGPAKRKKAAKPLKHGIARAR